MNSSVPAASFFSVFSLVTELVYSMKCVSTEYLLAKIPILGSPWTSSAVKTGKFSRDYTACLVHALCTSTFVLFEGAWLMYLAGLPAYTLSIDIAGSLPFRPYT